MSSTITRLGDLCTLITKGTTPTSVGLDFSDSGVRFLRVQNVLGGQLSYAKDTLFIDPTVHGNLKRSQIEPGDVLISIAGTIGRTAIVPDDAPELNCNQAIAILRTTEGICRPFLRHWLESADAQRQMRGATVTGTIQNLSLSQIAELGVPLPALPEQRRIAAILDKADALRTLRREALTQLDRLAQAIFVEMFGCAISAPKDWPSAPLGSVAEVQGGLQVSAARKDLPIEVPYLRVANVYRGYLNLEEIKTIKATAAEVARTTLSRDDLLLVEGHGNPEEIGRAAVWGEEVPRCVHQNHLIRVRFDSAKVSSVFACAYLNSQAGRRHLLRAGKTTSGLNTISVSNVRDTPLMLPPVRLQQEFAVRLNAIDNSKLGYRAALTETDALFTSLQHRAFRGEL